MFAEYEGSSGGGGTSKAVEAVQQQESLTIHVSDLQPAFGLQPTSGLQPVSSLQPAFGFQPTTRLQPAPTKEGYAK